MAATTTTLIAIIEEVANRYNGLEQGTGTGGSTTTIVCAADPFLDGRTNASTARYVGNYVYPTSGNASGERMVKTYAPSTGTFTISNAWASAFANTNTFDVFLYGVKRADIVNAVNQALSRLKYETVIPLSLITDGDMETSGTAAWTDSGATSSKVTDANALYGTQALRVANASALDYTQSTAISVRPDTTYYCQALVRAAVGTATLQAYDVTNSTVIDSEDYAYQGWGVISFSFSIPSTCESLAFRLVGAGASDDIYWDSLQCLRTSSREVPLPTSITKESQILAVLEDTERDYFDTAYFREQESWGIRRDDRNPNQPLWLTIPHTISHPIWVKASLFYPTLSADTGTTLADKELVVLTALVELLSRVLIPKFKDEKGVEFRRLHDDTMNRLTKYRRTIYGPPSLAIRWGEGAQVPRPPLRTT